MDETNSETIKKPSSNRSTKERRNTLFRVLDGVLSLSHKKIHNGGNSDRVKQGGVRVLVSAVATYGNLLKDEELELRVIALEEKLKNSVLIPKPSQRPSHKQSSSQIKKDIHRSNLPLRRRGLARSGLGLLHRHHGV